MQRDAFDLQSLTTLFEFRRPVTGANCPQIRKERTRRGQRTKDLRHFLIKAHDGNRAGLLPREADDAVFPFNVLGLQERKVGLRRAQMPSQLVKRLALGILLAGDDGLMFLPGDGPLVLELNLWPLPFHNHRPRQPGHVEREIMNATQVNVCRDLARFEHAQKMFGTGLQYRQVANNVHLLVLDGHQPAPLSFPALELHHLVHDILPGARADLRVGGGEIGAGDLQVHCGLLLGFVARVNQPKRRGAVGRVQAVLLARRVIVNVVPPAVLTPVESESLSHNCFLQR